jgi:alpha-galactosidase
VRAAAMVDPNTAATLTVDQIWQLCDELTVAHGDLLPEPLRSPTKE